MRVTQLKKDPLKVEETSLVSMWYLGWDGMEWGEGGLDACAEKYGSYGRGGHSAIALGSNLPVLTADCSLVTTIATTAVLSGEN